MVTAPAPRAAADGGTCGIFQACAVPVPSELWGQWTEDASTKPQPELLFLSRQEQKNRVTSYPACCGPLYLPRAARDRRWLGKHHRAVPAVIQRECGVPFEFSCHAVRHRHWQRRMLNNHASSCLPPRANRTLGLEVLLGSAH